MVNPEPPALEPELEALLREIARDPRSSLLRFPRPARPLDLARTWEAASRTSPGLTPAERHLLEVHRAETAQFLLDRWLHEVTARPRVGFALSKGSDVEAVVGEESADRQMGVSRLASLLPEARAEFAAESATLDFDKSLTSIELSGLVLAAERMLPSILSKTYIAYDQSLNTQPRAALGNLRRLLEAERRPGMRSHLWQAMGFVAGTTGDLALACMCYGRSIRMEETRLNPLAVWLVLCVQVGDRENALTAARRIDELVREDHPLLLDFREEQWRTRLQRAWAPTPQAALCAPGVREAVGNSSRMVLDVLGAHR